MNRDRRRMIRRTLEAEAGCRLSFWEATVELPDGRFIQVDGDALDRPRTHAASMLFMRRRIVDLGGEDE